MINFNAVEFSERHSEEVMFLLTLSVLGPFQSIKNCQKVQRSARK